MRSSESGLKFLNPLKRALQRLRFKVQQLVALGGDLGEVVDWITRQPWANGRVGGSGVSYAGNTAERLAVVNRPAVRAVIPRFTDFDAYLMNCPGGIWVNYYIKRWGHLNLIQDLNGIDQIADLDPEEREYGRSMIAGGPQPVDDDPRGELLTQALAEHAADRHPQEPKEAPEPRTSMNTKA